jgi:hypothetical protein
VPIAYFIDPKIGEKVPIEVAVKHFEESGISPGEVIQAIIDDRDDARRTWLHISPSIMNPDNNCRREIVIQRTMDYGMDPLSMWSAYEGTAWHKAFNLFGKAINGWYREMPLPGPEDSDHPLVRKVERDGQTFYELQIFDGIWMSGVADRVREDFKVVTDFKSTNYPWTRRKDENPYDFAESQVISYAPQVNLYARAVRLLKGVEPEQRWVWRIYRGSRNHAFTFRKLPIPRIPDDALDTLVREHALSLSGFLEAAHVADPGAAREAVIAGIPLDGKIKRMYADKKCSMYCPVKDICYKIAGLTVF